jgi:DNA-directed RNA polymerase specialized sigma24 family protein
VLEDLFAQAYPMARRAAGVRLAGALAQLIVTPAERPDFEQELVTAVWRALPKYDPARASLRTFVELVVSTRFISLLRSHRCRPMFESLEYVEPVGLDGIPAIEYQTDVQRVLAGVSLLDRQIARSLIHQTVTETGRSVGVSRGKVYRAIGRLRVAFRAVGFGDRRSGRRHEVYR